jgi:hypothetical protein
MDAFNQVHILTAGEDKRKSGSDPGSLVVAKSGYKTGDIVTEAIAAGLAVPLGARLSASAGL